MKIILFKKDGQINFLNPFSDLKIEEVIKKDLPKGIDYNIIDLSELPVDSPFLDALNIDLSIDIDKAQEITRKKLILKTAPEFAELDKDFIVALERGEDTSEIVGRKQELRDLINSTDNCSTIEELKEILET